MEKYKWLGTPRGVIFMALVFLVFTQVLQRRASFIESFEQRPLSTLRDSDTSSNSKGNFTFPDASASRESWRRPDFSENSERLLEQVESDVFYARQFVVAQLRQLLSQVPEETRRKRFVTAIQDAKHHFSVTQYDLWRLRNESGLLAWKAKELKELSALIQHRFHVLQNPADCKTAKKIICNIPVDTKSRGIGSQLHHLSYCFLASYGQQRTLIINSGSAKGTGLAMDAYYLPLSETCVHANGTAARWPGKAGSLIVQFPNGDNITPRHPYFPKSVPKDIGRRLVNANADPFAWWMGQFFRYAMRTASGFRDHVEKLRARLGFESPIVGVQVRRTDKVIREAKLIELEKYMEAAEDFFDDLEIRGTNVTRRRIYLATDDPNVVLEARKKYPNYKIVCNEESVSTANMKTRKSETNMKNFLTDVFFLYHSDYLVCSLSSNICRLAYELLQTLRPDAPRRIFSVDSSYWFHYEVGNVVRARYPHTPRRPSELEFQKGDRLKVIFKYYRKNINHQDGFLYGQNQDTGQFGLYPIYKTVEITQYADIPSFEHIDKKKK